MAAFDSAEAARAAVSRDPGEDASGASPRSGPDRSTNEIMPFAEVRGVPPGPGHSDAPSIVQAIVFDLQQAAGLLKSLSADHLAEFELNPVRHGVLEVLADCDEGCSQAELAQRLRQSESGVSTLVDRMRGSGLLYRLRSKADRRKRLLMIAPRGRELLATCRQRHRDRLEAFFGGYDSRALRDLAELLARLVQTLSNASRSVPADRTAGPRRDETTADAPQKSAA